MSFKFDRCSLTFFQSANTWLGSWEWEKKSIECFSSPGPPSHLPSEKVKRNYFSFIRFIVTVILTTKLNSNKLKNKLFQHQNQFYISKRRKWMSNGPWLRYQVYLFLTSVLQRNISKATDGLEVKWVKHYLKFTFICQRKKQIPFRQHQEIQDFLFLPIFLWK